MDDQIFTVPFHHYKQDTFKSLLAEIQRADSNQLSNQDEYIEKLVSRHRLTELSVDWDSLAVHPQHEERETFLPDGFGDTIRKVIPVYTFEVQYTGSPILFRIKPSTSRIMRIEAVIRDKKVSFEIEGSNKNELERIKDCINFDIGNQKGEVNSFNDELEQTVRAAVERRKQELEKHDDGLSAFGVPVKDMDN